MPEQLIPLPTLQLLGLTTVHQVSGAGFDYYQVRFPTLSAALAVWVATVVPLETNGAHAVLIPDADVDTLIDHTRQPPPPTGQQSIEALSPRRPVDLERRVATLIDDSPTSLIIFPFATNEEILSAIRTTAPLDHLIGLLNHLECLIVRLSTERIDLLPRRRMRDPENQYFGYWAIRGVGFVMQDRNDVALISWPDPEPEKYVRFTQPTPPTMTGPADTNQPDSAQQHAPIPPLTGPMTTELIAQIVATFTQTPPIEEINRQRATALELLAENRIFEATSVLYQVLYRQKALLGSDHPDTLDTAALIQQHTSPTNTT
jgi:hypothetical protein